MILTALAFALQAAPAVCTATVAPPAGLEAWANAPATVAGPIAIGTGSGLTLQPIDTIAFSPAPGRPPKPGTFGGVYTFDVATAGTYRIALGAGAWIDVIRDGRSIPSSGHAEGPACSGIRKIVEFSLTRGRYALQLSGAKEASAGILIVAR